MAPSQRPRSPRLFTNPPSLSSTPPPPPGSPTPHEPLSVPSHCQPLPVLAACQVYLMVVAPLQPHATFAFAHLSACPRLTRHFRSARTVKIGPSPYHAVRVSHTSQPAAAVRPTARSFCLICFQSAWSCYFLRCPLYLSLCPSLDLFALTMCPVTRDFRSGVSVCSPNLKVSEALV